SLEYPSGLSLFINGAFLADSGSMNLFLETGSDVNSSGISLFTYGGFSERCNLYLECFESGLNTVPLYLLSYLPESESTNLFILGGTSSTMNLYLQGPQGIEESGNVHLSI